MLTFTQPIFNCCIVVLKFLFFKLFLLLVLFQFLATEFLGYIEAWRDTVMARPGFSKTQRNKMFLTQQTYEGLKTTGKKE